MRTQSSHDAQRVTAGDHGHEVSNTAPGAPECRPLFTWTGRDIGIASMVAFALGFIRQSGHGEAILDSSVELQCQPPRQLDAWRFFHAARKLRCYSDTLLSAQARALGKRIALAATGLDVIDCHVITVGGSVGFVWDEGKLTHDGELVAEEREDATLLAWRTSLFGDPQLPASPVPAPEECGAAIESEDRPLSLFVEFPRPMGAP